MSMQASSSEPPADCRACPRLAAFRDDLRNREPDWFNAPVPSFGSERAELLIVGLAPGMKGANRTGRPFTGDYAGDLLYATLGKFGFAEGRYDARPDDGLTLTRCTITNAVRCLPPQNKPTGAEIRTCTPYLVKTIAAHTKLKVILALGRIAHDATLDALGERRSAWKFGHGAVHETGSLRMIDSYHCSRYNTNTRRLTPQMFEDVFVEITRMIAN